MLVIQTNIWVCEVCGYISSETNEVFPYTDPPVYPPNNESWEHIGDYPNEKLACPKCIVKDK